MRRTLVPLLALLAVAIMAAPAGATPGGLTMTKCVSVPSEAALRGCASGTDALRALHEGKLSPDGKQLYVAGGSPSDGAPGRLATFDRDAASGALTFAGCFGPVADGCVVDSHLSFPAAFALSPGGEDLYVADYDKGIVQYRRAADGALTFARCLTPTAVGGCTTTAGIAGANGIAVGPNGKHVYVSGYGDDTVVVFTRDETDGELTFLECKSTSAAAGCAPIAGSGLDNATDVAVAPDGEHVLVSARAGDAATTFTRDTASGALTAPQTLSDEYLQGAQTIAAAPDGKAAYVGLFDGSGLTALSVAPGTGTLSLLGCFDTALTAFCSASPGVNTVFGLEFSPAGDVLYAASRNGNSLSSFRRAATGSLSLISCVGIVAIPEAGCSQAGNALADVASVAPSADGRFVYGVGGGAVTTLVVEPEPAAPKPPAKADLPRPIVKIVGKRARLSVRGKLKLTLRCVRGTPDVCAGRLTLRSARKLASPAGTSAKRKRFVKLGGRPFAIRQGKSKRLTITVPKAGRKLVAAKGKLGVRLAVTVRNPRGQAGSATRRLTLLAPRR